MTFASGVGPYSDTPILHLRALLLLVLVTGHPTSTPIRQRLQLRRHPYSGRRRVIGRQDGENRPAQMGYGILRIKAEVLRPYGVLEKKAVAPFSGMTLDIVFW